MNAWRRIFRLSVRNLRRHPLKNAFVAILIFLASTMFFAAGSMSNRARETWRQYLSQTFVGEMLITAYPDMDRDYTRPAFDLPERRVTQDVMQAVQQSGMAYSKRIKTGAAVYLQDKGEFAGRMATLVGVDFATELPHLRNLKILEGKADTASENGVLVWYEFAESFQWKVGDEVTLFVKDRNEDAYPYTFSIMGIVGHQKSASLEGKTIAVLFPIILAPYQTVARQLEVDEPTEVVMWGDRPELQQSLALLSEKNGLQLLHAEEAFGVVYGIVDYIDFIAMFMAVFIITIVFVATLNLNIMGYFERRREIGTMLAMGAKPSWVFALLITETWFFASMVFAGSLLVFWGLCQLFPGGIDFGKLGVMFAGNTLRLQLFLPSVLKAYAVITTAMLVSTLYPVYLATRINPIEVFRDTGT